VVRLRDPRPRGGRRGPTHHSFAPTHEATVSRPRARRTPDGSPRPRAPCSASMAARSARAEAGRALDMRRPYFRSRRRCGSPVWLCRSGGAVLRCACQSLGLQAPGALCRTGGRSHRSTAPDYRRWGTVQSPPPSPRRRRVRRIPGRREALAGAVDLSSVGDGYTDDPRCTRPPGLVTPYEPARRRRGDLVTRRPGCTGGRRRGGCMCAERGRRQRRSSGSSSRRPASRPGAR
jgi:hypothetical protein